MTPRKQTLQAVLFDWAGTTIDYGSRAPMEVFLEIFRRRDVQITLAEARGPMGKAKRDHIAALLQVPRIAQAWCARFGREPGDADVESMYEEFLPLQRATLARGIEIIPGVLEAVGELRRRGLKIGSTTGYTRGLMEVVVPLAAAGGYQPDVVVCADDVPADRPAPWMNFRAAEQLGVYPMSSVVVVDDTPVGIEAGLNAGALTVGVSQTGNALGLPAAETAALPAAELSAALARIEREFRAIGAQHVIRSVADLPELLDTLGSGSPTF